MALKRRSNFLFPSCKEYSGSTSRRRARLASEKAGAEFLGHRGPGAMGHGVGDTLSHPSCTFIFTCAGIGPVEPVAGGPGPRSFSVCVRAGSGRGMLRQRSRALARGWPALFGLDRRPLDGDGLWVALERSRGEQGAVRRERRAGGAGPSSSSWSGPVWGGEQPGSSSATRAWRNHLEQEASPSSPLRSSVSPRAMASATS